MRSCLGLPSGVDRACLLTTSREELYLEIRLQKLPAILAEGLVILTLLLAVSSGGSRAATMATTVPSSWIKGVNMIGYSPDPYNVANQHDAIGSWKSLGGNAIA